MDGRVLVFPSTSPNELRVNVYDPLRGVPVAELKVRKSYATGKHLASSGLDPQIYLVYRVAVDHYTLNPTKVALTSHPYKGRTQNVKIDENILRKILESAKDVLSFLDNY